MPFNFRINPMVFQPPQQSAGGDSPQPLHGRTQYANTPSMNDQNLAALKRPAAISRRRGGYIYLYTWLWQDPLKRLVKGTFSGGGADSDVFCSGWVPPGFPI